MKWLADAELENFSALTRPSVPPTFTTSITWHRSRTVCTFANATTHPIDSKTYQVPLNPYEAERLDHELKVCGEYGLRNKREIYRIGFTLSKIRRAARELLTLDEKDSRRLFDGNALIRRLIRIGVLDDTKAKLDYVLALKIEDFMERRLQTLVFKLGLAKSIHHARVLIRQRHIRYSPTCLLPCSPPNFFFVVLANKL